MLEIGRGVLVVIAGYLIMTVLVIFSSIILGAYFPGPTVNEPSEAYVTGNLVCGFLAALFGGWATARIAAMRPLAHTGALVALLVLVGVVRMTSAPLGGQPDWYPAAIVAIGAAGALIGGLLGAMQRKRVRS